MTTSEQRAELIRKVRQAWDDLPYVVEENAGTWYAILTLADALEASEAEKQRLIEAVRSEIELARGYRPGSRELGRVPYVSISSAEVLDTACTQAEVQ